MRNNGNLTQKYNVMVWGETGCGKTALSTRVFLAQSDISQLKESYTAEDKERLAESIRKNCTIWYSLKPGDNDHGQ
ncbi:hypothetical protein RDT67_18850 [Serratia fonticola]|uniref:ATP-dependent protease Clp ATPase subunit n=2 Tax=Enterobacterales TaxID=91347 RepID=A0A0N9NMX1_PECCA|nr:MULTISPECIES: hypothetical protein [Enterobacterales]ALG88580.1 ATP-dependent protease Clp ATPase subunit [Pectobacterium carotovorum]MDQ9128479.1 hypothetical protein [Serratia fonticola]